MGELNIERINELARKSKTVGLTAEEVLEQKKLRENYLAVIRANIRSQMDNIDMVDKDGKVYNVGDRHREKYGK